MAHDYRGSEVRREKILANFRNPLWKQQKPQPRYKQRFGMDAEHLENLRRLECVTCPERRFLCAHHIRFGPAVKERGVGLKATDRWAVPLCIPCHASLHEVGSRREDGWWKERKFDADALCRGLWAMRGDLKGMSRVVLAHKLSAMAQLGRNSKGIV